MKAGKSCANCYHYLGGIYACCGLNLEKECREGGGYEAWKSRYKEVGPDEKVDGGRDDAPVPQGH